METILTMKPNVTVHTIPTVTVDNIYLSLDNNRELGTDGSTVTVHVLTDREYKLNIMAKYKELHKLHTDTDDCLCLEYGCENNFTAYPFYKKLERDIIRQLPEDITINTIDYTSPDIPKYNITLPRYTVVKSYREGRELRLVDTMDIAKCDNIVVQIKYTNVSISNKGKFNLGIPDIVPLYVRKRH